MTRVARQKNPGVIAGLRLLAAWNRIQALGAWRRMSRDRASLAFSVGCWLLLLGLITVVLGQNLTEILQGLIREGGLVMGLAASGFLVLSGAWLGQVETLRIKRLTRQGPLRDLGIRPWSITLWSGLVCGLRALGSYALPVIMTLYFGFSLLHGLILIIAVASLTLVGAILGAMSSRRVRVVQRDSGAFRPDEESLPVQRLARRLLMLPDHWQASLRITADASPTSLRLFTGFFLALVLCLLIGLFLAGPDNLLVRSLMLFLAAHLMFCSLTANLGSMVRLGRGSRMPVAALVRDTLWPAMILSLTLFVAGMMIATPWYAGQVITMLAGAATLAALNMVYHGARLLDGLDNKESWRVQYAASLTVMVILLFVFGPLAAFIVFAIQTHRYRNAEYRSLEYA